MLILLSSPNTDNLDQTNKNQSCAKQQFRCVGFSWKGLVVCSSGVDDSRGKREKLVMSHKMLRCPTNQKQRPVSRVEPQCGTSEQLCIQ